MGDASEKDFSVTLKVPELSRDLMVEIAAQLRSDPAFHSRLQSFVDDYKRPSLAAAFEKVLARLESLELHVTGISKEMRAVKTKVGNGKLPEWTTGQGNRIRLTPQGEEEVERLLYEGLSDIDIAIRMGVSGTTVGTRRRNHDRAVFENSLKSADR